MDHDTNSRKLLAMNSVRWTDLVEVGKLLGSHGYAGQIKVHIEENYLESFVNTHRVFLSVYGDMVPLIISDLHGSASIIASFQGVETDTEIKSYIGAKVYLHASDVEESEPSGQIHPWTGYEILSEAGTNYGTINEVLEDDFQTQVDLGTVNGDVIRIPLPEDWILSQDDNLKKLIVHWPEGLWELYSQ